MRCIEAHDDDIHRALNAGRVKQELFMVLRHFLTNILKRAPAWRHNGAAANLATMVMAVWFSYSSF
jgi:hypothetical protein